jgi:hypothetical protein
VQVSRCRLAGGGSGPSSCLRPRPGRPDGSLPRGSCLIRHARYSAAGQKHTGRTPHDADALSADSRAHGLTRVAFDLIAVRTAERRHKERGHLAGAVSESLPRGARAGRVAPPADTEPGSGGSGAAVLMNRPMRRSRARLQEDHADVGLVGKTRGNDTASGGHPDDVVILGLGCGGLSRVSHMEPPGQSHGIERAGSTQPALSSFSMGGQQPFLARRGAGRQALPRVGPQARKRSSAPRPPCRRDPATEEWAATQRVSASVGGLGHAHVRFPMRPGRDR